MTICALFKKTLYRSYHSDMQQKKIKYNIYPYVYACMYILNVYIKKTNKLTKKSILKVANIGH